MHVFDQACLAFFHGIEYYHGSKGAGITAAKINNYFSMWSDLHKSTVNISDEGWKALHEIMKKYSLHVSKISAELFLFSVETYLDLLMKMVALNRIGQANKNRANFQAMLQNYRSSLPANVLEWYLDVFGDPGFPAKLKTEMD